MDEIAFRADLYRGTAEDYDRFRVPYPPELTGDLASRAGADGRGRLMDLACGTGQLAFGLCGGFAETWAVDQEPDMVGLARRKATAAGLRGIRFAVSPAEELSAPDDHFDLVTIGNAFHRLPRDAVAARVHGWLVPGGLLALVWGGNPWIGEAPWQQVLAAVRDRWMARVGGDRVPAGYERDRARRPDAVILGAAGFEPAGSREFVVDWQWTPGTLIGFCYSTAVLSRAALGSRAAEFEAELRGELLACVPDGVLRQAVTFDCELARRPG